jgi:DNA-binding response OmpR family regulator
MKVLIVEDDPNITSFIAKGLVATGHVVSSAATYDEARTALVDQQDQLDLVLLDLGLPGGDGEDILRWLRRRGSSVPVIVLTARAEVSDRVRGLDAGANDYLVKPFDYDELLARMRAVRRTVESPGPYESVVADLRMDKLTKVAWRGGRRIELAPREWELLELFMSDPTRVWTRTDIVNKAWNYDIDPGTNVVDVYVGYLRRKLNRAGLEPMIHTVRRVGYRLIKPSQGGA